MPNGPHLWPCRLTVTVTDLPEPAMTPPDVPAPPPMIETPWYRRSSVGALWKTCTGFAITALSGGMSWKDAGVAAGVALLGASYDILFGPESFRHA